MKPETLLSIIMRFLLLIVICLLGCASLKEKSSWERAQQLNNVESYKTFYLSYPKSEYVELSKLRMEDLAWAEAKRIRTNQAYLDYLNICPSSNNIAEIIEFMNNKAEFRSSLELSEFKSAMGPNPIGSNADIQISPIGIRSPNMVNIKGTMEFTLGSGQNNNWGLGARHTLSGTLKMYKYTFISHPEDQLVFRMLSMGYVYQSGSGIIVTPEGAFIKLGSR